MKHVQFTAGIETPALRKRLLKKIKKKPRTFSELISYEASINRWSEREYECFAEEMLNDMLERGEVFRRMENVPMGTGYDRDYNDELLFDVSDAIKARLPLWMFTQWRCVYYDSEYYGILLQCEREEGVGDEAERPGEVHGQEDAVPEPEDRNEGAFSSGESDLEDRSETPDPELDDRAGEGVCRDDRRSVSELDGEEEESVGSADDESGRREADDQGAEGVRGDVRDGRAGDSSTGSRGSMMDALREEGLI